MLEEMRSRHHSGLEDTMAHTLGIEDGCVVGRQTGEEGRGVEGRKVGTAARTKILKYD